MAKSICGNQLNERERAKEVTMGKRIIRTFVVMCIAWFGLRGVLPDIVNEYGFTVVLLALAGGALAYEIIADAVRKMRLQKKSA